MKDLQWQLDWRGNSLQNIRLLVCNRCLDTPQEQLRTIRLPADPLPVQNARVEPYTQDEESTGPVVTTPYGVPVGLVQGALMPNQGYPNVAYAPLSVLSAIASGNTVTVTCGAPHNLANTGLQVSVLGLTDTRACGFFSVTATTATVFTYSLYTGVSLTGSLLGSNVSIVPCNIGLPLGQTTIPIISAGNE